ncbi:TonB-dependent receptor [Aestuariibacter sp. GS-14]|uniref:TonB-dependent receptor n=1 Tax=Aestuariibacter sp. GS-14 TaxID=2590670 RepID=UPI00112CBAA7|nr:TonB-dependent receptor [Aestuariibacter sp. GS-14]TPV60866.1 TonB-dependent receptor [Aestuariibacter sp. GS-14]
MTKARPLSPLLLRSVIASVPLSSLAFSAIAQSEEPPKLEIIEVSAQKRTQNLQEVPVAVTALNGTVLAEKAVFDIYDIERGVPTLSAFQSQSATNSAFAIRGIGTSSQNFGFESSVGLYVDGVYRARQNSVINDLTDISTVEILRGPQGSLFGKNTPSGAVVINTQAPDFDNSGFFQVSAGNYNTLNLNGAASFTAIDDILAFRISGFSSQRDGWVEDTAHPDAELNNRDRSGIRLQALFTPSQDISVRVIADYAELDERCCAALTWRGNLQASDVDGKFGTDAILSSPLLGGSIFTREQYFNYQTALSTSPRSAMQDKGLSAQLDWQLNDTLTLVSVTAYRQFDSFDNTDTDFSDVSLLSTTNDATQQAVSQELRLHYQQTDFNAIVGAFLFHQSLNLAFTNQIGSDFPTFFNVSASELQPLVDGLNTLSALSGGFIAPAAPATPGGTAFYHTANQDQDSIALFAQSDWQFLPQWTLTTGIRFTRENKSLDGQYTETGPGIDGLSMNPSDFPNPFAAGPALAAIGAALSTGSLPDAASLAAIAPFQTAGWGFYFLNTASVLPRPPMQEALSYNNTSGTVKLSYQPNSNQLFYASWGNGFKSGGINTDRIAPGFDPVFLPEKSNAFELGVKQDFPEHDLRVNLAVHRTDIEDFQASTFTGTGFNLQNAGTIETKGLELDITWLPLDSTQVTLNFARTLAHFDEFENGTCWVAYSWHTGIDDPGRLHPTDPYCSRAGDRVGFEPQTRYTLGVEQYADIFNLPTTLRVDYQYTGDLFLDDTADPFKHVGDFDIVNASWMWELPEWQSQIILWSKNLFDTQYVAKNGFDVPVQTGKIMAYPGMPRTYGVTLRTQF